MIILISGATKAVPSTPLWVGRLMVPRQRAAAKITNDGRPWALDNGAFKQFNAELFIALLARFAGRPGCLFVAVPDVVGNSAETLARFERWAPVVRGYGFPVALVGQDGMQPSDVPWNAIDALFIGGTTAWKLGSGARALAAIACALGKWVHMGRVNSLRRLRYAESIGCSSIDGTGFTKHTDEMLRRVAPYMTKFETASSPRAF